MTTRIKQNKFTLEFKQDAARLVIEKGYSYQQAAESLGISVSAMGRWVRSERVPSRTTQSDPSSPLSLGDHDELVRLRQENARLLMEREILKKAAVFFAREAE